MRLDRSADICFFFFICPTLMCHIYEQMLIHNIIDMKLFASISSHETPHCFVCSDLHSYYAYQPPPPASSAYFVVKYNFELGQSLQRFVCSLSVRWHFVRICNWQESVLHDAQIPLGSTRLDSTRSTLSSQSSKSRRACRARRAVLFQHGGRRTILYEFSRFYALAYTNPICFIK